MVEIRAFVEGPIRAKRGALRQIDGLGELLSQVVVDRNRSEGHNDMVGQRLCWAMCTQLDLGESFPGPSRTTYPHDALPEVRVIETVGTVFLELIDPYQNVDHLRNAPGNAFANGHDCFGYWAAGCLSGSAAPMSASVPQATRAMNRVAAPDRVVGLLGPPAKLTGASFFAAHFMA